MTQAAHEPQKKIDRTDDKLIALLSPIVEALGYEIIFLDIQTARQKTLRIFIDFLNNENSERTIGIEDCAKVTKALDEPLETMPEVDKLLGGSSYELEVSSPGVDRPLRTAKDYERFSGRDVRIHLFRPLTAEEIGNSEYLQKNPKQKHFIGVLKGVKDQKIKLVVPPARKKASEQEVEIPVSLVSKANLEPKFDMKSRRSSEE